MSRRSVQRFRENCLTRRKFLFYIVPIHLNGRFSQGVSLFDSVTYIKSGKDNYEKDDIICKLVLDGHVWTFVSS